MPRRSFTTFALALALAGCAHSPRDDVVAGAAPPSRIAGAALDLGAKFRIPDREKGRRAKAEMNAEYLLALEADENGPPSGAQIFHAHEQRHAIEQAAADSALQKSAGLQPSQWQALGPSNIGGRVRAIAFDPGNASRVLAGTASGGLWISADAGASWRANHDFLPNLSVTSIVFDPANANVVYLGTGEASAGLVGVGAFKSIDGGNTWQFLAATNADASPDWRYVNRLAVHPSQTRILLAALTNDARTSGAIYRSVDAGATWARVSTAKALDIAFDPNNASNAVAGLDDGTLAYSRDAGASWSRSERIVASPSGRRNTARAEIAFARSQFGVVYASIDNNKGEIWRSADSGATWQLMSAPGHLSDQGDYANAIWVDPTDANHVIAAGLDIYQSRDGGMTFTKVSDWRQTPSSAHADHHALVSPPNFSRANPVLYNGDDGGIYRADNVYAPAPAWINMNNGLAVTQFYSGAGRTAAGGRIIGGTQDNGALMLAGGAWRPFRGGDGGYVAVDPANDQIFYGEYVYLAIHRSLNGGASANYVCEGIAEALPSEGGNTYCGAAATKKANFIAPFILDPNDSSRLLAGAASLWVSDNARGASLGWHTIKDPSAAPDNFINAIAVAEGDGALIWVGHSNGEVYRTLNGSSPVPVWTRVGQGVLPARQVQRITIDRDNPNRVIVAVTGFVANDVWQTLDAGLTWSSITGNLPQAPVFDVKRHPRKPNWLYAATSVGVFTSENAGASWSTTNEGPANIRVRELFWIDDTTLGAATYGRGMFKVNVAAGGPDNYQDLWWSGPQENGWGLSITQHRDLLFSEMFIYDAQGRPQWVVMPSGSWNASFTAFTGPIYIPSGAWFAAYDASRHSVGAAVGTATLTFASAGKGTLAYTINGVSGTKAIERIGFGPVDSTPVASYGDLWWGGTAQNGWGLVVNQQYRTLFLLWYTYERDGRPTWFVVSSGTWTAANVYTGTAYRASGPPWIGVPYDASRHSVQPVGSVTVTFGDIGNAVMTYTIDGVSGGNALVRVPF
jgi:hypothetical protein